MSPVFKGDPERGSEEQQRDEIEKTSTEWLKNQAEQGPLKDVRRKTGVSDLSPDHAGAISPDNPYQHAEPKPIQR